MNVNMTLKCEECDTPVNCRIGMSNRDEQPLSFHCPECSSPIEIFIGCGGKKISGAIEAECVGPFDQKTNFVDLHLDFPVYFGEYQMGRTPFLRAAERIGLENIQFHSARLNQLNGTYKEFKFFKTLLKFYQKGKIVAFKNSIEKRFNGKVESDRPEDINASLYMTIAHLMFPFALADNEMETVALCTKIIIESAETNKEETHNFLDEILETGFLKKLQSDCLDIYPKILDAELTLRPALFLDFDKAYREEKTPMRVSNENFETHKDLYKDITEIIARQITLVAGINNLKKRGDHNTFKAGIGAVGSGRDYTPKNLRSYADISFGKKREFIDDCWFDFTDGAADNQLRNAIAHNKTEYDEVSQVITYYPKNEGLKRERSQAITFLEFMRRILLAYREMHKLHHLIKCLFNYEYIIRSRLQEAE